MPKEKPPIVDKGKEEIKPVGEETQTLGPNQPEPVEAATVETPAAEPAPTPEAEVPLISDHDMFRSMSMPTQNAAAEGVKSDSATDSTTPNGNTQPGIDPLTGTTSAPDATATPGGQPATGSMGTHTSNVSATAAVGMFDFGFALLIGLMLSKVVADDYRASDGEKNELAKALAPALAASNIVISPWYNVILVATAIYGPKAYKAYNDNERAENTQRYFDMVAAQQAKQNQQRSPLQSQTAAPRPDAKVVSYTAAPQAADLPQTFTVKAPEQPIINTGPNCPTCNASVDKGKRFCDRECAARFEVDKRRLAKNQQPMYMGLSKAAADKVAKANAPKKTKTKAK